MCPRGRPRGQGRPRGLHLCSLEFRCDMLRKLPVRNKYLIMASD